MVRVRLSLMGIFLLLTVNSIGASKAASKLESELQKLIDQCWALSQEQRDSGITAVMAAGAYATEGCFQENSTRLAQDLYKDPDDLEHLFLVPLIDARNAYLSLVRKIDQRHDFCSPCGTEQIVVESGYMAFFQQEIFEKVFRNHWHYVLRR